MMAAVNASRPRLTPASQRAWVVGATSSAATVTSTALMAKV
jgi:hypothetical protein